MVYPIPYNNEFVPHNWHAVSMEMSKLHTQYIKDNCMPLIRFPFCSQSTSLLGHWCYKWSFWVSVRQMQMTPLKAFNSRKNLKYLFTLLANRQILCMHILPVALVCILTIVSDWHSQVTFGKCNVWCYCFFFLLSDCGVGFVVQFKLFLSHLSSFVCTIKGHGCYSNPVKEHNVWRATSIT